MLRPTEFALVAEALACAMSNPRPQDPGFRAPLRDIVDSIGTGRHVDGIHMYDKDDRRIRQTVFQLPDGLGVFDDDDTASEASSGAHTDSVFPEGDDDDSHDDNSDEFTSGKSETGSEEQDGFDVRRCDVCRQELNDEGYGIDDDTGDDGEKMGDKRRRKSIPCLECERPKRRKIE